MSLISQEKRGQGRKQVLFCGVDLSFFFIPVYFILYTVPKENNYVVC